MAGKQSEYYKELEELICKEYRAGVDSLRDVAERLNTNHKLVKRVLDRNKIEILKAKPKPMADTTKKKLSDKLKGRQTWNKGIKMPKESVYKNMATHLRFDVDYKWLMQFEFDKLKVLNDMITNRSGRYNESTEWYKKFIEKFYNDENFIRIHNKWIIDKDIYMKPSVDHIVPRSKGGTNELSNLQILTWFENKAKRSLSQEEWDIKKSKLKEYLS